MTKSSKIIIIGASSGGVTAIQKILGMLKKSLEIPIVVIQHIPDHSRVNLQNVYGQFTTRAVQEAFDKMPLEKNNVYFAPPNYHLLIEKDLCFALNQEEKVYYSRPSIDMSFSSAGRALGGDVCAVLLTGANEDGAKSLSELNELGAYTIVQDPETAEVDRMPKGALKLFTPNFVGGLDAIAVELSKLGEGVK